MAKGQMRKTKEKRKPKQEKPKGGAGTAAKGPAKPAIGSK